MARKVLDKKATKKAILRKALSSRSISIKADAFNEKINSVKDILEACVFVRVEAIYK